MILGAERAVLAGVRIESGDGKARMRNVKARLEIARHDASGLHHEIKRQLLRDVRERQMNGDWHHRELGRPQHHHWAGVTSGGLGCELAEELRVTRLGKA